MFPLGLDHHGKPVSDDANQAAISERVIHVIEVIRKMGHIRNLGQCKLASISDDLTEFNPILIP